MIPDQSSRPKPSRNSQLLPGIPADWNEHLAGEEPTSLESFDEMAAEQAAMDAILTALTLRSSRSLLERIKDRQRMPLLMSLAIGIPGIVLVGVIWYISTQ